jgi:hypothetical protein
MTVLKLITQDNFDLFVKGIETGQRDFIPMLAFVKNEHHDFDRYKKFSPNAIYLIDYVGEDYCMYHLYSLKDDDRTLRTTLILPSNWDRRFEIVEKSLPNIKNWFLSNDNYDEFLIQVLEYGEVEYYPTLSYYMVPTIIKNQFVPQYKMYLKRSFDCPQLSPAVLPQGYKYLEFNDGLVNKALDFYYNQEHRDYMIDYEKNELIDLFKDEFFTKAITLIGDDKGNIVAASIGAQDTFWNNGSKMWMGNLAVSKGTHEEELAKCLMSKHLDNLSSLEPQRDIIVYLDRSCQRVFGLYESFDFIPFEFWIDARLKK